MTITAIALTVIASCFAVVAMNGVPVLWAVAFVLTATAVVLLTIATVRAERWSEVMRRELLNASIQGAVDELKRLLAEKALATLATDWAKTMRPETAKRRAEQYRGSEHGDIVAQVFEERGRA